MKISLYSDLHVEFEEFEVGAVAADVIVFAGDIHIGEKGLRWIEKLQIEKPVIYVLGNHEYYGHTYPKLSAKILEIISKPNIFFLENRSAIIDGACFHGCTLWTDYELFGNARSAGFECQQSMTDFKKIRTMPNYSKLRSLDVAAMHRQSVNWLGKSLENSSSPLNVVVTHHAPSMRSVPNQFRLDIVTAAYVSNLEHFIEKHTPDLWLHGHLHNSSDYKIGGCRVVCNPRGYAGEFNEDFDPNLTIELRSS